MKVVALAGGTGSAKLLRGLYRQDVDLTVVANVGDNIWMYGVYVCPDIDVACYSLAGVADKKKGWGIRGDTFEALAALRRLGAETWFALGDRDLATCLARTGLLRSGKTLTEATLAETKALGLDCPVLPASDDPVETRILTGRGDLHLQEFRVRDGGKPRVSGVTYQGASKARLPRRVEEALEGADRVVVCPANPVTSVGPILAVPGLRRLLTRVRARKVALSPMEGRVPFSGPAGKLMKATGVRPGSAGVVELYRGFLDAIVISNRDSDLKPEIENSGVECILAGTRMNTSADEIRLAGELLEA